MIPALIRTHLPVLALLGLAACATGKPVETYAQATERLSAECQARGGILEQVTSASGRPETDNICKITGGASRLTRSE